jgi:hypothetical protein
VRLDLQDCGLVPHPGTVTEKSVSVAGLRPVPVMLAGPIPALPGRRGFRRLSAEPKYDGCRVLLLRYDGRCVVQSRRGTGEDQTVAHLEHGDRATPDADPARRAAASSGLQRQRSPTGHRNRQSRPGLELASPIRQ